MIMDEKISLMLDTVGIIGAFFVVGVLLCI